MLLAADWKWSPCTFPLTEHINWTICASHTFSFLSFCKVSLQHLWCDSATLNLYLYNNNNNKNNNKEAISSVLPLLSPFASFWWNLWNHNEFWIFFAEVILIKIANTPLDRSAALVLSVINWTCCSCIGIRQKFGWSWTLRILEKLAGFRICRSRNPVQP